MKKIKEISKKYLIGLVLGIISAVVVVVHAAASFPSNQTTYNNAATGMKATNVQTAIDELYNTCFPPTLGDQILEQQPIEKDPYECRYFFTGKSPNNYITFNDEKAGWRIISVECDGTIKIIRDEQIGTSAWDESNSNDWTRPSTINRYLNGPFDDAAPLNQTYYDKLTSNAKSQISTHDFSIGALETPSDLSASIKEENSVKWNGKIGLITATEVVRINSNKTDCYTVSSHDKLDCRGTTWLYDIVHKNMNGNTWTITPSPGLWGAVYVVGYAYVDLETVTNSELSYNAGDMGVVPVLYLSKEVELIRGNGSKSNPYVIK